ncbi:hypothetical protein HAX54_006653 [Datura stramonium]|uniref:Uncharacterized protein n=1 Tax=Datura stramonium TaxID=4076 RepID=A0ABS8TBX4_DATST|nr:hypothetical protein [Datura stramonium]
MSELDCLTRCTGSSCGPARTGQLQLIIIYPPEFVLKLQVPLVDWSCVDGGPCWWSSSNNYGHPWPNTHSGLNYFIKGHGVNRNIIVTHVVLVIDHLGADVNQSSSNLYKTNNSTNNLNPRLVAMRVAPYEAIGRIEKEVPLLESILFHNIWVLINPDSAHIPFLCNVISRLAFVNSPTLMIPHLGHFHYPSNPNYILPQLPSELFLINLGVTVGASWVTSTSTGSPTS